MALATNGPLTPGTIFAGDYEIVAPLKTGGMGVVYEARQRSTGQLRALKVMRPELLSDAKQRARFEQEARIGSRFESEHAVAVIGAGVDDETHAPWLAMELLHGEQLSELVGRGALPPARVLLIAEQIAHAVGAAHAAGIVHRDLKPANVFLAKSQRVDGSAVVKILDFGIAKIAAEAKHDDTEAIGSPRWMAPEQTDRGGRIGPWTDVWSIGLIVFYLLTGRIFWRSAEDKEGGMASLYREIVLDPIPAASTRAEELGCAACIPEGFDDWLERSLDRDPYARPQNATTQLEWLREILGKASGAAHSAPHPANASEATDDPTTTRAAEKDVDAREVGPKRRAWLPAMGLAAAVVVAVGGGRALLRANEVEASPPTATSTTTTTTTTTSTSTSTSTAASTSTSTPTATSTSTPTTSTTPTTTSPDAASSARVEGAAPPPARAARPPLPPFDKMVAFEALRLIDVSACKTDDGPTGEGSALVAFAFDGTVERVKIARAPFAGTAVGACVERQLKRAHIDPFGPGNLPQVPTLFTVR